MRRASLFCAFAVVLAAAVSAQASYVIVDTVRLPAESFVGDPVELRYTIRSEAAPVVPEELPQPEWGRIDNLRLTPQSGGFDVRLTITPYRTGTLTLPAVDLGSVRLEGLSVLVLSILGPGDTTVHPALGPERLPGTSGSLVFILLMVILVIVVPAYFLGPGRKLIAMLVDRYRAQVPYRRLLTCVQTLNREIGKHSMRDFYITLMESIQGFLDSRLTQNCRAATAQELISFLPSLEKACGVAPGTAAPLEEVMRAADSVKFAKSTIRRKKRSRHLLLVHAVATELETHRRKIRSKAATREAQRVGF